MDATDAEHVIIVFQLFTSFRVSQRKYHPNNGPKSYSLQHHLIKTQIFIVMPKWAPQQPKKAHQNHRRLHVSLTSTAALQVASTPMPETTQGPGFGMSSTAEAALKQPPTKHQRKHCKQRNKEGKNHKMLSGYGGCWRQSAIFDHVNFQN